MLHAGPAELVTATMAVVGALLFTLGLGELLWHRRAVTSLLVIDPLVIDAGAGARASGMLPGASRPATPTIDGGELVAPQNHELPPFYAGRGLPAPGESGPSSLSPQPATYQALVLAPAGKWGSYWQEVARCQHRHPLVDEALRCGLGEHRPYSRDGAEQILAVGVAE